MLVPSRQVCTLLRPEERTLFVLLSCLLVPLSPLLGILKLCAWAQAPELENNEVWVDRDKLLGGGTFGDVFEALIVRLLANFSTLR
jgi:hypothetical protein